MEKQEKHDYIEKLSELHIASDTHYQWFVQYNPYQFNQWNVPHYSNMDTFEIKGYRISIHN